MPTVRHAHWYTTPEMSMVPIYLTDPLIPLQCLLLVLVDMFRFTPHCHLSFSGHQFFALVIIKHHQAASAQGVSYPSTGENNTIRERENASFGRSNGTCGFLRRQSQRNLQVKLEQGLEMLSILKTHKYKESILDAFAFYDKREAAIRRRTARQQETRTTTKNQISKRFVQVVKFKGETSNVWIPKEKTSSSNGADSSTTPKDVSKPGMVSEIKSS
ncbi:hypothetical protein B296_00054956 [Ensete ventricosum]|uniref:YTH domain-containing family protein n=1 Tax=Ensete ventricosum TaxID=4639 RepID=A0A426XCI9_ENSVE|nr:hypothetical protein B296_00054956 [Ensete ventricosum]